jgi:hypothetical protein
LINLYIWLHIFLALDRLSLASILFLCASRVTLYVRSTFLLVILLPSSLSVVLLLGILRWWVESLRCCLSNLKHFFHKILEHIIFVLDFKFLNLLKALNLNVVRIVFGCILMSLLFILKS